MLLAATTGEYTVSVSRKPIGEAMSVKIAHGAGDDAIATFEMNDAGMHVLGPNKMGESEVVMVTATSRSRRLLRSRRFIRLMLEDAESGVATPEASPTDEMPNTVLQITSENVGMVMATQFRAPADSTATVEIPFKGRVEDDTSTTNVDETAPGKMVRGTFNGAMGTYQCVTTANCTVEVDAKGVVSAVSATSWVFMPDDGVMVNVDGRRLLLLWLLAEKDGNRRRRFDVQRRADFRRRTW